MTASSSDDDIRHSSADRSGAAEPRSGGAQDGGLGEAGDAVPRTIASPMLSTTILRALRLGSLLTALGGCALLLFFLSGDSSHELRDISPKWAFYALTLLGFIWLIEIGSALSRPRHLLVDVMFLSATGVTATVSCAFYLQVWWKVYSSYGTYPHRWMLLAIVDLLAGATLFSHILLSIRRVQTGKRNGAHDDPSRWGRLAAAAPERGAPGEGAGPRRYPFRRSRFLVGTAFMLTPSLVLLCAFAVVPHALSNHRAVLSAAQTTAPAVADDALPAVPSSAPTSLAWDRDIESGRVLDVAAGARGPVVLDEDTVRGLDPQDGSTLWSYQVRNASLVSASGASVPEPETYLVPSPDLKHLAFQVRLKRIFPEREESVSVIVLDTITGGVAVQHSMGEASPGRLQLTDSAVLIRDQVFSLADGHHLGTLTSGYRDGGMYSGSAGHSTFIAGAWRQDKESESNSVGRLDLVPDTALDSVTTLQDVALDPISDKRSYRTLTVVDGAVTVYTDGGAGESGGRDASAVSIDDVGAHGGDAAERVALGRTAGLNRVASMASRQLVMYPELTEQDIDESESSEDHSWVGSVFDPAARTVSTGVQDASMARASVGYGWQAGGSHGEEMVVRIQASDGSASLAVPISSTSTADDVSDRRDLEFGLGQLVAGSYTSRSVPRLVAVPGGLVILVDTNSEGGFYEHEYRIYGVK